MCVKAVVTGVEGVRTDSGEFEPRAVRLRFYSPEDEQLLHDWKAQGKPYPLVIVKTSENDPHEFWQ